MSETGPNEPTTSPADRTLTWAPDPLDGDRKGPSEPDTSATRDAGPQAGFSGPAHRDAVSEPTLAYIATVSAIEDSDRNTLGELDSLRELHPPRLSGFEILGPIGQGGMGEVWKARRTAFDKIVALKVLLPQFAGIPTWRARFQREAAIGALLNDPRILPIHDFLEEADGRPVIVLPFIDGPSLRRVIDHRRYEKLKEASGTRRSRPSAGDKMYLMAVMPLLDQLVDAVAAMHRHPTGEIVHRDIKPSNVLADSKANVYLSDFGLARSVSIEGEAQYPSLTQTGASVGTHGYMPPEQWEGRPADKASDVFSLGVTVYEALTLRLPYGRHLIHEDTSLAVKPSRYSKLLAEFDRVLLKAIEPRRIERFADAEEFARQWRSVRAGLGDTLGRRSRLRAGVKLLRKHRLAAVNLGMTAVVLALIGYASLHPGWSPPPTEEAGPPREVIVVTEPPGARFAIVRLHDDTGEPLANRVIAARADGGTLALRPGDYLVEAIWPSGRFHEVYRHVPGPRESQPSRFSHARWQVGPRGEIALYRIKEPPEVLKDMTRFAGSPNYLLPPDPDTQLPAYREAIPPFYLDRTEVTVGKYQAAFRGKLPPNMPRSLASSGDMPVVKADWDQAAHDLEVMGKRLMTESEYLFAALNGDRRTRFPWGDGEPADWSALWRNAPVGSYTADRTLTTPPVLGLLSGPGEWTSSRFYHGIPQPQRELFRSVERDRVRVARGSPKADSNPSKHNPGDVAATPLTRLLHPKSDYFPERIGFRGARSARPRFLK